MLTGTIILKDIWLFATFVQSTHNFAAKGLMHAALQSALIQADLAEHSRCRLRVQGFAIMRSTRQRNLSIIKTKTRCSPGRNKWNALKRLGGGTHVRDRLWSPEVCHKAFVTIDDGNMTAMA
jgi:hypothetical protein